MWAQTLFNRRILSVEKCTRRNINEIAAGNANAYRVEPSPTSARVTRSETDFSNVSISVIRQLFQVGEIRPGRARLSDKGKLQHGLTVGIVGIVFDGVPI